MPYVSPSIPLWAQGDIDKWIAFSGGQTLEEAKGSHEYFRLLAYEGSKVICEGIETDTILIIWHVEGVTFIKCYGDSDVQLYLGTMEGFHKTYIAYPEDKDDAPKKYLDT
jgi:hypothetical protein